MHSKPYRIAQLTDSHILATSEALLKGANPFQQLQKCFQQTMQKQCDALLLTGDISQEGSYESYELVKSVIQAFSGPIIVIPGNHDDAEHLQNVLGRLPQVSFQPVHYFGDWALLHVPTLIPGKDKGEVSAAGIACLRGILKNTSSLNIGLVMHHPPLAVQTPAVDEYGLVDSQPLLQVIDQDPRIRLVIAGHVHHDYQFSYGHALLSTAPATCFQYAKGVAAAQMELKSGFKIYTFGKDVTIETVWIE